MLQLYLCYKSGSGLESESVQCPVSSVQCCWLCYTMGFWLLVFGNLGRDKIIFEKKYLAKKSGRHDDFIETKSFSKKNIC